MEKNLFSIRKAGRQGGRARGGSASLPADGREVAEVALPAFQFYLSASDGSKVARWLSDPSGRQGGSEVALSLLMLPEVALLIHEGREVERWLSLLMVARWQRGRAASLC